MTVAAPALTIRRATTAEEAALAQEDARVAQREGVAA